jgi:hypothetical protein
MVCATKGPPRLHRDTVLPTERYQLVIMKENVELNLVHSWLDLSVGQYWLQISDLKIANSNRFQDSLLMELLQNPPSTQAVRSLRSMYKQKIQVFHVELLKALLDPRTRHSIASTPWNFGLNEQLAPWYTGLSNGLSSFPLVLIN